MLLHKYPSFIYFSLFIVGILLRSFNLTIILLLFFPFIFLKRYSLLGLLALVPLFSIYANLRTEKPGIHLKEKTTVTMLIEGNGTNIGKIKAIFHDGLLERAKGSVYVRGKRKLDFGTTYIIRGRVGRIDETFDSSFARYLKRKGVSNSIYPISITFYERRRNLFIKVRSWIEGILKREEVEKKTGFYTAILLGDRERLSYTVKETFRKAGIFHMLALSGLHIGILSLIFYYILLFLRIRKKHSRIVVLLIIFLYLKITGFIPSLFRASLIFFSIIISYSTGRKPNPLNALGASGFISLLYNPNWLFSVGFELSYLATFGIMVVLSFVRWRKNLLVRYILIPLSVTFAAQLFTLPVILFNFGGFSLVSPLSNLILVPVFSVLLTELVLAIIVNPLSSSLSMLFFKVGELVFTIFFKLAEEFSSIPHSYIKMKFGTKEVLLCYISLAILLIFSLLGKHVLKKKMH